MAGTERQRTIVAHAIRGLARVTLVLLAIRVAVLLFAPSPDDERVAWFLLATQALEEPFRLVMHTVFIDPFSGSILDTVALTAMVGYALIEAGLIRAINFHPTAREPMPPIPAGLVALSAPTPPRATRPRTSAAPVPELVPTAPVSGDVHPVRRS